MAEVDHGTGRFCPASPLLPPSPGTGVWKTGWRDVPGGGEPGMGGGLWEARSLPESGPRRQELSRWRAVRVQLPQARWEGRVRAAEGG